MKWSDIYTWEDAWTCHRIQSVSGGKYGHVLVSAAGTQEEIDQYVASHKLPLRAKCILPMDDGLVHLCWESVYRKDPLTGKTGVRGPFSLAERVAWVSEDPKRRGFTVQDLPPITPTDEGEMLERANVAVRTIGYAPLQIIWNWRGMRFGAGVPLRKRSPDLWTCVEFAMRILPHDIRYELRWVLTKFNGTVKRLGLGDFLYDEMSPSGRRGPGLFEMVEDFKDV